MKIEMTTTLFSCRHLALFAALLGGVIAQGSGQGVAGSQSIQIPQAHQSTVYRDTNGVPHIVAESEVGAWYALGYEQARDAFEPPRVSRRLHYLRGWSYGTSEQVLNGAA